MDRGQSLIIPHLFDGINCAYWKVCMRAFLQSLDEKVWQAVEIGQIKPKEAPANWDDAKIKATNFNSRALNALFNAVTNEEFKKIFSIETAKEVWTILQTTYEGTKAIKDSKFQRLVGKIDVRSGKKNGSTSLENDNMCYVSFRIRAYLGVVKFKSKIRSSWEDF